MPLFLFKIKSKQSSGCLNKEDNAIFAQIQQNIRAHHRNKKIVLINDYENNIAYSEESKQSEV